MHVLNVPIRCSGRRSCTGRSRSASPGGSCGGACAGSSSAGAPSCRSSRRRGSCRGCRWRWRGHGSQGPLFGTVPFGGQIILTFSSKFYAFRLVIVLHFPLLSSQSEAAELNRATKAVDSYQPLEVEVCDVNMDVNMEFEFGETTDST